MVEEISSPENSADCNVKNLASMNMDNLKDTLPVYEDLKFSKCGCGKLDCFYQLAKKQFGNDDGKSIEGTDKRMVALFQNVWLASYSQKLTSCILGAIRTCIEACKRSESPDERLIQFYDWHLEGSSLPTSIILHTLSVKASEVYIRHSLLHLIIDEIPLTAEVRFDLCQACAKMGCNDLFDYIHSASSSLGHVLVPGSSDSKKEITEPEKPHVEIGRGLRLRAGFVEDIKVEPTSDGWQVEGFVPDMLQRLHANMAVHTEFVARGLIWHMSITATAKSGRIMVTVLRMESSESIILGGKFSVSPEPAVGDVAAAGKSSSNVQKELSINLIKYTRPGTSHQWIFLKKYTEEIFRHMNKDGRCYFKLRAVVEFED